MIAAARQRRRIAIGLVALAASALLALAGANAGALLAAGLAAAALALAVRGALATIDPAPGAADFDARSAKVRAAVLADLVLGTAWQAGAWVRRVPQLARAAGDVEAAVARWRERGWLELPERAHALPPPLEKVEIALRGIRGGGTVEHLRFASEYEPADPEIAAAFLARRANRTAHALLWRRRGAAPRPTLVSIHGFGMGRLATDVPWLRLRGLDLVALHEKAGVDVAYVILPFHGPRSEGPSGAGFFDQHPLVAAAALGQAIWDLRRITGWLRAQGVPSIGVHGLSLGGCVAALLASLDASLAAAIPMCPAVDLAQIFLGQLPEARRREWIAAGLGPERLAEAWSLHAPLRHRPRTPHAGRLIVAACADQVTVASGALALHRHWDEAALHWMPGGHMLWLGGAPLERRLHEHLCATLLAEPARAPSPPLSRFRRPA
ncbi:MAG: hypothetical protein DCC71_18085 [Proteobacteria bacterium]|nr:MAG: hypothetical protein DCC71_18085 [Pseudomonadota bacterium]